MAKGGVVTHGKTGSKEYSIWVNMKQRCLNPNNTSWRNYGGRGITICKRWLKFENFYADMGERPKGLTLDRIDNDKGYSPQNCRWTTMKVQALNRSSFNENKSTGHRNVYYLNRTDQIKNYQVIMWRNGRAKSVGYYLTLEEALKGRNLWLSKNN